MLNVDDKVKSYIINNLIENKLEVLFPNNSNIETITMDNIVSESMTLKQSICNESKLKFGGCIASEFTLSVCDTDERLFSNNIKNKWIVVKLTQSYLGDFIYPSDSLLPSDDLLPYQTIGERTFNLFCGYVDKFERDADDRHTYKLTAYDYMAKLNKKNGTNKLIWNWSHTASKYYWLGLMMSEFIGISQSSVSSSKGLLSSTFLNSGVETKIYEYPTFNEPWVTDRNAKVTYGDVVRNCCEMLGAFGYIMPLDDKNKKEGDFALVYLDFTDPPERYDFYEDLRYEDYKTNGYTKLSWKYGGALDGAKEKITNFELDTVAPLSATENVYDLTDNVFCWENEISPNSNYHILEDLYHYKKVNEPSDVAKRFYDCGYTPFTAKVDGRPWVQVGDNVEFNVYETDVNGEPIIENGYQKLTVVKSVVLSRTLTGIQALTDTFETKGEV